MIDNYFLLAGEDSWKKEKSSSNMLDPIAAPWLSHVPLPPNKVK
jgi:hypothetical protein